MKRRIYRVLQKDGQSRGWKVQFPDGKNNYDYYPFKREAVAAATRIAKSDWYDLKIPSQVVVTRADGTIQYERTYGRDPERSKG